MNPDKTQVSGAHAQAAQPAAQPSPIPEDAPVTSARLPSSLKEGIWGNAIMIPVIYLLYLCFEQTSAAQDGSLAGWP